MLPALAAALLQGAMADSPAWSVPDATLRLALVADAASGDVPAAGYALLATGPVDPARARITVTDSSGAVLPSAILWARPGEPLLLAFDTAGGRTSCWAYLRGDGPDPAGDRWRPKAGVLLESRPFGKPCLDSRSQFEGAWNAATSVLGRSFKPDIFDGVHSHGPPDLFMARYDGWFPVRQAGDYGFATTSDDASFLSVDGRPVAEWPGIHNTDAGRNGEKHGSIRLEPGLHHLRYEVAQSGALYAAVASWRPPGKPRFTVMQPADFAPLARFSCAAAEAPPPQPAPAHFEWRLAQSAKMDSSLLVMAAFRAMPVPQADYRWDFGDGATGRGALVEHAYIGPGPRTVRLDILRPGLPAATLAQAVAVHPVWRQAEECPDGALFALKDAVQARPLKDLSATELETVALFAHKVGDRVWLEQAGQEILERNLPFTEQSALVLEAVAATFRHPLFGKYPEADILFGRALAAAEKAGEKGKAASLRLAGAENRINGLFKFEEALALLAGARDEDLDPASRRRKTLLTADALMSLGRREASLRTLRSVAPAETNTLGAVRLQARLAAAADLVRRGEWDAAAERLEGIMADYPRERFSGETGLLLMEAWAGRGETIPALVMAERLLKTDLLDDLHARLLLRAADLHRKLEDPASVQRYLDELMRVFPYSEAAAAAGSRRD